MRVKFIVNPEAGRGKAIKAFKQVSNYLNYLKRQGVEWEVAFTSKEGEAISLAREAALANFDRLVVIGGDGLVNEVANGMARLKTSAVLGIIPAGTANDFARNLGILSIEQAIQIIIKGKVVTVDLGRVNGRYYVNVFGLGFDAQVAGTAERIGKKFPWLRGYISYTVAILKELFSPIGFKVTIEVDGKKLEGEFLLAVAANIPTYGRIFRIAPQAKIDDGWLDLCLITKIGKVKYLPVMERVIKGVHRRLPEVATFKAREIRIRGEELLNAHVDGEVLEPKASYLVSLKPKALQVAIP